MKPSMIAGQIAGMLVCVGVGLAGGMWFMKNYDIVPRGETPSPPPMSPNEAAEADLIFKKPEPPSMAPAAHNPSGPFSYKFKPGETLRYAINAELDGTGLQLGDSSPVDANFAAVMNVSTQSVDSSGNGSVDISFESAQLQGMFMGGPVDFRQSGSNASFSLDGTTQLDTSRGDSLKGVPQLEFLSQTIHTIVAPDGRVMDVRGPQGFDQLLSSSAFVSPVRFKDDEIPVQTEWTSDFSLPVPGIEALVPAQAHNVLVGYQDLYGRRCGVIQQTISAADKDGKISMPSSQLGEAMGLSMPEFNLTGQNMVYFDVETGHVVRADMDMGFKMELGQNFSPVASLVEAFSGLLNEVEGGDPAQLNPDENAPQELVTIDLGIKASMGLID
ncbi:MAG: hypothetical protein AMXMBFR84_24860 [Candidatus Hydrogenedentota bacterium]